MTESATKQQQGLSQTVASYLKKYFSSHNGSIPNCGLYQMIMWEVEKPLLEQTLEAVGGNQSKAAAVLGINRNTLRKKLAVLGISENEGL